MMEQSAASKLRPPFTASKLLDMYFFEVRSHLLETAAALDRIERAPDGQAAMADPRIVQLMAAFDILKNRTCNRAEQFLQLFSDPL